MYLLESIKVFNKKIYNLSYHSARMNRSRKFLFASKTPLSLTNQIKLPENIGTACYKCRIIYSNDIHSITYQPYVYKAIQSLKIIHNNTIDYSHKYTDRSALLDLWQQKGQADDVLIIKNEWITDTFYCNIAFYDGEKWLTPNTPLLAGTKRAKLLDQNKIIERAIKINDLKYFKYAKLINAMLDWDDTLLIPIKNIN